MPPSALSPARARFLGFGSWLWLALPLALLWLVLINQLRVEWAVNPQYAYGWAVPFLCLYLLWQRLGKTAVSSQAAEPTGATSAPVLPFQLFSFQFSVFVLLAFLFLPIRLVQEANPQWGLTNWLVALDVVGLTLLALHLISQLSAFNFQLSALAFPICYFLVAVPWPTLLEYPLIQGLTRANVAVSIELLNWCGLPAIQHGNTIEISAGVVGIDEACSGIRSFQATLMISLFLGELYRLSPLRRTVLCLSGFAMSFLFNLGRTLLLTVVASRKGLGAVSQWHDPAGVTILVACFAGLWAVGTWLKGRGSCGQLSGGPLSRGFNSVPPSQLSVFQNASLSAFAPRPSPLLQSLPLSVFRFPFFFFWVLLVIGGVELWYRLHERGLIKTQTWTLQLPRDNPTFKEVPMPEAQRRSLRYDELVRGTWQEPGPVLWHVIHMVWKPGRVAAHLAQGHMPEGCLAASGKQVSILSQTEWLEAHGLTLPFRVYEVKDQGKNYHVFYCVWQDYVRQQSFARQDISSWQARFEGAGEGRRNLGQRSLEIVVWGFQDAKQAQAAVQRQLESLLRIEGSSLL